METKVIRIYADDFDALQGYAEPFTDKPKDVITKMVVFYMKHHKPIKVSS